MIKALSPLNILIIGKLRQFSGNTSTANRIRQYFEENGFYCVAKDIDQFKEKEKFIEFVHDEDFQVVLGIHALHAGSIINGTPLPYGLIFGGTDLNENTKDPEKMVIMTECVERAKSLIAFSAPMESKARRLWPEQAEEKLQRIPQAVATHPSDPPSISLQETYRLGDDAVIFTLVAGIRPVKDPLHLVQRFTDWHQLTNRKVFLVIIGPKVDINYYELFEEIIDGCPGIIYLGSQTIFDTHAIVKESFALINSSVSEGMALSILEAMDLGVPVIARNIPGNSALIEDNVTGILYTGPEDFIEKAEELLHNDGKRRMLIKNAQEKLAEHHGCKVEKAAYLKIANRLKADYNPDWYEEMRKAEEEVKRVEEEAAQLAAEQAEREAEEKAAAEKAPKFPRKSKKKSKWEKVNADEIRKLTDSVEVEKDGKRSPRSEKSPDDSNKAKETKSKKPTPKTLWDKLSPDDLKKLSGKTSTKPEVVSKPDSGCKSEPTGVSKPVISQSKKSPVPSKRKAAKQGTESDTASGSSSNGSTGKRSGSFKCKSNASDSGGKISGGTNKKKTITVPKAE